jgi:host factor-I protein
MAAERSPSLQDTFLDHVRKNEVPLTIFLANGVRLQGVLTWFDNFSLLLTRNAQAQLVYKQAISTIVPTGPIHLFEPEDASEPAADAPLIQIRPRAKVTADD